MRSSIILRGRRTLSAAESKDNMMQQYLLNFVSLLQHVVRQRVRST